SSMLACAELAGIGDYAPPPTADAAADGPPTCPADFERCDPDPAHPCNVDLRSDPNHCGPCHHARGAGHYRAARGRGAGRPGPVVYVSPDGSDENDGCTTATPQRTIASALAFVKGAGAAHHEVHVCAGTYAERALAVDYPVSILGGFACNTWTRTA